jgi:hypothetical protein
MVQGYVFLCSDATEAECLEKKLLGGTGTYLKQVRDLKLGDFVYLYNFNSKRLHGPFVATTGVTENMELQAWGGGYSCQVRFSSAKKYLPVSRDQLVSFFKFNKKGFPIAKLTGDQVEKLEILFKSEIRHTDYDDSAALVTKDGHKVRSEAERKIDDWLFDHSIAHAYEYAIPETKRCDFYLPTPDGAGIYVEYWGLKSKEYEANKELKLEIYKRHNLKLLEIFPDDLIKLDQIFSLKVLIDK